LFKADIKNIEDQRVVLEHEKMRSSMIRVHMISYYMIF
jgi:hypothetical protein